MKYLYWIGATFIVATGLYISTQVTYQPLSEKLMPFTQMEQAEDFGRLVAESLKAELATAPLIFLGVMPNQIEDVEAWRGFLDALADTELKYDLVMLDPKLPYVEILKSDIHIDVKLEMFRFAVGVKNAIAQGHRVAVVMPTIYSTQLLFNNPADKLKGEHQLKFKSLSIAKFPLSRQQEEQFDPPCTLEPGKDPGGTGPLGCMIVEIARRTYRESLEKNMFSGLMDKTKEGDYLLLLNRNPMSR